jgi:LRR receptor-like serine/threonine-protein kinase FLS2
VIYIICNISYYLIGSISPLILNLKNLTVLNIDYNQLTGSYFILRVLKYNINWYTIYFIGSIPCEFAMFSNFVELIIEHNLLSGTLPSCLGEANTLTLFDINFNSLTG